MSFFFHIKSFLSFFLFYFFFIFFFLLFFENLRESYSPMLSNSSGDDSEIYTTIQWDFAVEHLCSTSTLNCPDQQLILCKHRRWATLTFMFPKSQPTLYSQDTSHFTNSNSNIGNLCLSASSSFRHGHFAHHPLSRPRHTLCPRDPHNERPFVSPNSFSPSFARYSLDMSCFSVRFQILCSWVSFFVLIFLLYIFFLLNAYPFCVVGFLFSDDVCKEVACGRGKCKPLLNDSAIFLYECECDPGWRKSPLRGTEPLKFLPCTLPNCKFRFSIWFFLCQPLGWFGLVVFLLIWVAKRGDF